ncbi:MAG TPA: secretin N-terminal domain-containing protein [Gemmatimonadaceae bacterium]|nr:secretin N-terminal domain-containing protein [Gemmatimonadaceae bacterium]
MRYHRRGRALVGGAIICAASVAGAPVAHAQRDTARAGATRIDFQDADLRAVITAIAEAGALNVTYGEIPNRRVTLHLRQSVSRADMLPLLRSVAAANGLRVVEDGSLLRVEAIDARPGAAAGTGVQQAGVRLFVYRLRHARAARLAATLQTIYGNRVGGADAMPGMSGRTLSEQLRGTTVPPLVLDTLGRGAAGTTTAVLGAALHGEIQIVPDETTNSLLIRAQAQDYETIRQAVEVLDLRPLQVFIEVLIAEVRRTKGLDVGITGTVDVSKNGNTTTVTRGTPTDPDPESFLVRLTRGGTVSVDLALNALATRGNVRILSRPLIMAENNLEARITVGSQRPFVQVFRSLPTESAARDQVVQYRDVGTTLTLLPTINPDGYVNMQVKQEVSSATNEVQFGAPVISNREATTHLFVKDHETVVIGGLADRQVERSRNGIPILSSIPFIGGLFGGTHDADTQSELYLFLTPHIVATDADAERIRRGTEQRLDSVDVQRRDNPAVVPAPRQPQQMPTTPRTSLP